MKKRTSVLIGLLFLGSLITVLLGLGTVSSSSIRLSVNPQEDAQACVNHPTAATCAWVSPFGRPLPGSATCADQHASVRAFITLTDPGMLETPLGALQLWWSPTCQGVFASAYTTSLLVSHTLTVQIAET